MQIHIFEVFDQPNECFTYDEITNNINTLHDLKHHAKDKACKSGDKKIIVKKHHITATKPSTVPTVTILYTKYI